jgi:hypothetical protein
VDTVELSLICSQERTVEAKTLTLLNYDVGTLLRCEKTSDWFHSEHHWGESTRIPKGTDGKVTIHGGVKKITWDEYEEKVRLALRGSTRKHSKTPVVVAEEVLKNKFSKLSIIQVGIYRNFLLSSMH